MVIEQEIGEDPEEVAVRKVQVGGGGRQRVQRRRGAIFSSQPWARGAVGSASDWQSEGQGFESPRVHQLLVSIG
jgi:hypothetical protein